ncbi:SDR family oxidoreductase [Spirochaetia bacterium 38H-sp]|uniref:SDR family oxidoreductase n=1 Tax=Rarispira pelagica TaxID=3141764 RepID=A0ABU9U955_9SPIR
MNVVITGSTRGLGRALAEEFLKQGDTVFITGRTDDNIKKILPSLENIGTVYYLACDVRSPEHVRLLAQRAWELMGSVDIWINNAGITQDSTHLWEATPDEYQKVIKTNLLGSMYGSREAFLRMKEQGYGHIFNMEGWGSDGKHMDRLNLYGTSKAALRYFTLGFSKEVKGSGVNISLLSPGMMFTDLLINDKDKTNQNKLKIYKILADPPEIVAGFFVENIKRGIKNGRRLAWLTFPKILFRFLTAPARIKKSQEYLRKNIF